MGRKKKPEEYAEEIRELHEKLQEYPESETLRDRLHTKLRAWVDRLEITVMVDNDGLKPWTSEELGLPTKPSTQKTVVGSGPGSGSGTFTTFNLIGNYQAYIHGGGVDCWCGLLVKRRKLKDLYGLLIDEDGRAGLYEEFDRFVVDPRFSQFCLYAECTREELINYFPPRPQICKYCEKCLKVPENKTYWCCRSGAEVPDRQVKSDYSCSDYKKRERTEAEIRTLTRKKRTVLSDLETSGLHVCWQGSREEATKAYSSDVRRWVLKNYDLILGLKPEAPESIEAGFNGGNGKVLISIGECLLQVPREAVKVIA